MKRLILSLIFFAALPGISGAEPWLGSVHSIAAASNDESRPAVAHNAHRDEYLVVWEAELAGGRAIFGRRLDASGLPISGAFAISDAVTDQFHPDVSYDPIRYRYLVVWVSDYSGDMSDTDILGRLVPWDGPTAGLPAFNIDIPTTLQLAPKVTYSRGTDEYLVVWHNEQSGSPSTVSGRLWKADGSGAATLTFAVAAGADHRINPAVAWNPGTSQYLVVYEKVGTGSAVDVWATLLSHGGGVMGAEIGVAGWPGEESEVDVVSCRGGYLVAWKGVEDTGAKVWTRLVSGSGVVGVVSNLSGSNTGQSLPALACNETRGEFLISWQVLFGNGHEGVVGGIIELDGIVRETFNVYGQTGGNVRDFTRPAIAKGAGESALVVWEDENADLATRDISARTMSHTLFADGFESASPAGQFQDCSYCPLMVDIPGGSFQMGDINGTGNSYELPVHPVNVPAFAMGVYEVTFDEWDTCYLAGGCSHNPGDEGWGRGTRPVINVNWDDVQEYVNWLSAGTGKNYRLPSESEWEYATRAGTTTEYWWGDPIGVNQANCTQNSGGCGDSFTNTAPVHTFSANAYGLYNVHGNVWEWVADWWNDSYTGAPNNGDPWLSGDSGRRVLRGGAWYGSPIGLRSAGRVWYDTTIRYLGDGFRVAQDQN